MTSHEKTAGEISWVTSLLVKGGILGIGMIWMVWIVSSQSFKGDVDFSQVSGAEVQAGTTPPLNIKSKPRISHTTQTPLPRPAQQPELPNLHAATSRGLIDLNFATPRELAMLPGIGTTLANRIVVYREEHGVFRRIHDVGKVSGIGQKRLQQLTPLVTVESMVGAS